MAKRMSKSDKEVASFFALILFGIFCLIKWAIEFIESVIRFLYLCDKKIEIRNIIKQPYKNNLIKNNKINKLGIFDKSIYDDYFTIKVRYRGEMYYCENRIKSFKKNDNTYSCIVVGNNKYKVNIRFDENDNIISTNCTCPYHKENNQNCKHIYALLYKIKCDSNRPIIIKEINDQYESTKNMIELARNYINNNNFSINDIIDFENYTKKDLLLIEEYKKGLDKKVEDNLLQNLKIILDIIKNLKKEIKNILNKEQEEKTITNNNYIKESTKKKEIEPMNDDNEELEKEMDNYDLEEWQKDLVREGSYDPSSFDEEDLEEDDYYYEDDE